MRAPRFHRGWYPAAMHPIEHLRHVARSRAVDESELVREAAIALGSMRAERPDLVVACRRIVERHAEIGALWWLCARLLICGIRPGWHGRSPTRSPPTPRRVWSPPRMPDDATVLTIGWPAVAGAALLRRGDASVLCADSRHDASGFLRQLERADIECDPIPAEIVGEGCSDAPTSC